MSTQETARTEPNCGSPPRTTFMKHKHHTVVLIGCSGGSPSESPELANLGSRLRLELDELGSHCEAEFADVASAIAALLATVAEPHVLLVHVRAPLAFPEVKRSGDLFTGHAIGAHVNAAADPSLFIGANRDGAAQVVPIPLARDDFQTAMRSVVQQLGGPRGHAEVVAVAGVTGGCGAT